ncbi:MAG: hypothetical protein CSB46_08500 [Micrococcales bacterium]|nr:MAG: hypothetical protein CSB46_08500 [Micrococcales bacterium]
MWAQLAEGVPASHAAGTCLAEDLVVLDVDSTVVLTHSEEENAAPTFKRAFGFHPIRGALRSHATEFLAGTLRAGNAGVEHCGRSPRGPHRRDRSDPRRARIARGC